MKKCLLLLLILCSKYNFVLTGVGLWMQYLYIVVLILLLK